MTIEQFIYEYYINPIIYNTGYNPVNTLTWGTLLGVSVLGVLKLLKKLDIKVNRQFILAVVPYILAGGTLRVMEDAGVFAPPLMYLFVTPLVHFVVFIACVVILLILAVLRRDGRIKNITPTFGCVGIVWAALTILILFSRQSIIWPWVAVVVLGIATILACPIYLVAKRLRISLLDDGLNMFIIWAHLFDASSTFIGVDYMGYKEKHILGTFLTDLTGTGAVMYPLKLMTVIPILYLIDTQFLDDGMLNNVIKLVILVLGMSTGLRNTLRMTLGV